MLWTEKYRPTKLDDAILPEALRKSFQAIIDSGELPNMLLTGKAGMGKTTIAYVLAKALDMDVLFINGSDDRNIDVLRNKVRQFASTVSLTGSKKLVIIDEADYLNAQSTQPALRAFMEEFADNCRFILTCNFKTKIIEPLQSRLTVFEYSIPKKDMPKLAMKFFTRCKTILKGEGIDFKEEVLATLIQKSAPDWRRVLNMLQQYSATGEINAGILSLTVDAEFDELIALLKAKNFRDIRKWVATHSDVESHVIFRKLYDTATDKIDPKSVPQLVLILADYQHKAALVMDQEINTMAAMTEIMSGVQFK